MKELNEKQREKHLATPWLCPCCSSCNLDSSDFPEPNGEKQLIWDVSCLDCGALWRETYQHAGVTLLMDGGI